MKKVPRSRAARKPDPIDDAIASLRRACPGLDFSALDLFARLTRLGRLVEAFNDALLEGDPLSFTDMTALILLKSAGPGALVTPGAIGLATLRSSPGVTAAIDRLQSQGLVRRIASSQDRRSVNVELTAPGHERCEAFLRKGIDEMNDLLAGLDRPSRARSEESLRILLGVLEGWRQGARGGPRARNGGRKSA